MPKLLAACLLLSIAPSLHANEELAAAQTAGDLHTIQALANKFRARDAASLHKLMLALDPSESRAFISAHILARNLLLDATRTGNTKFVADAAKVVAEHAKGGKIGKCARAMKLYADGLTLEDDDAALNVFSKAHDLFCAERWTYLAMHGAVEIASRSRDEAAAVAAIEALMPLYPKGADASLGYVLRDLIAARLAEAPKAVRAAADRVYAQNSGPRSVSAAGGAGAKGGRAGQRSKVGEALDRYPRRKALVTVQRTKKGFEMRESFDKKFRYTQKPKHGLVHKDNGGVTVGFWGSAVGLAMVDATGRRGQPGESSAGPAPHRAFYFLARKEKWSFDRMGRVTIK